MKLKLFPKIIVFFIISTLFFNCTKSEDGIPADLEVQNFVWRGLNAFYLWQGEVPDLADTRFNNQNQLNDYLQGSSSPENLFGSLLYTKENGYPEDKKGYDRFSWIVDDYVALENSFEGITLNNGMEFRLLEYANGSSNAFGYVRYVIPGSDAATKLVTRGMIFNQINGTQITENNYRSLLANTTYTIGLAEYNGGNPIANGKSISLTKENIQENPILVTNFFDEVSMKTGANRKIGYIMYNQFASSFDGQLNAAFLNLKAQGVNELIVDLRYNGGGSVKTATYLSSMITGQFNDDIFSKQSWNEKATKLFNPNDLIYNFTDEILNTDASGNVILQETINSLNLSTVYFIVTGSSASASELVINSLSPYIDVRLIGAKTVGKQVGSITLYDSDNLQRNGDNLNTNHTYAMQPLVLEIFNSIDNNEPGGFIPGTTLPGVSLSEDYGNLGVLGEKSDPLLNTAINYITGSSATTFPRSSVKEFKEIYNSKMANPSNNNMYVDFK